MINNVTSKLKVRKISRLITFGNLGSAFVIVCKVGFIARCVGAVGVFPVVVSHSPASSAPALVLF